MTVGTNTYSVSFDETAVSPVVSEFESYHMYNPEFTWSEAHDRKNARIDYYAHLLGTDWWNNLHKNRVIEPAKVDNKTIYYACRATIVHDNITNEGLFQLLGDGISLDTTMMRCNLGRVSRGRGQRLRLVDNYGFDRPGAVQEEQQEIRDETQDAPPFSFPRGAVSATSGAFPTGGARPGSGSFNGGRDKDADRFLSDQSRDDAQAAGSAQPSPPDTSHHVTCLEYIDQSAHRMVDVQWIA
ncbi:MAG: hypothetical protein GY847_11840, partial [Proteobacteria bacterium]|nr:hypothetical protein [Pseudomonadota bacterium]